MWKKSTLLRQQILRSELSFFMEAHSGIAAKIVEEAEFEGIWASGLAMSASMGLRDCNEASWTQVVDNAELMAEATTLPILLDGDTGYGNFNNVRRVVKKLCERGIAGVCLEDKLFPKMNSFVGDRQPLADVNEFAGRLRAAKDSQTDEDFVVVARTETFIAGFGVEEALSRASAYHQAGADAILVHSKLPTAEQILTFAKEWAGRAPLVIVPTTYYATPAALYREAGISVVIWGNHLLRASVKAMGAVARSIRQTEGICACSGDIAELHEIFRLVQEGELAEAELRYLPRNMQTRQSKDKIAAEVPLSTSYSTVDHTKQFGG